LLFLCDHCQWWDIRESWDYCEWGVELDYIVVGREMGQNLPSDAPLEKREKPWRKALADPDLYAHAFLLPPELARIFPGGKIKFAL
jgi:hypothetical protein